MGNNQASDSLLILVMVMGNIMLKKLIKRVEENKEKWRVEKEEKEGGVRQKGAKID